jgi:hypothetical protein
MSYLYVNSNGPINISTDGYTTRVTSRSQVTSRNGRSIQTSTQNQSFYIGGGFGNDIVQGLNDTLNQAFEGVNRAFEGFDRAFDGFDQAVGQVFQPAIEQNYDVYYLPVAPGIQNNPLIEFDLSPVRPPRRNRQTQIQGRTPREDQALRALNEPGRIERNRRRPEQPRLPANNIRNAQNPTVRFDEPQTCVFDGAQPPRA